MKKLIIGCGKNAISAIENITNENVVKIFINKNDNKSEKNNDLFIEVPSGKMALEYDVMDPLYEMKTYFEKNYRDMFYDLSNQSDIVLFVADASEPESIAVIPILKMLEVFSEDTSFYLLTSYSFINDTDFECLDRINRFISCFKSNKFGITLLEEDKYRDDISVSMETYIKALLEIFDYAEEDSHLIKSIINDGLVYIANEKDAILHNFSINHPVSYFPDSESLVVIYIKAALDKSLLEIGTVFSALLEKMHLNPSKCIWQLQYDDEIVENYKYTILCKGIGKVKVRQIGFPF